MEEEWDVLNSLQSSETSQQNKRFRPSVELDFNRFESMPQFQLDEDSLSSLSFEKDILEEEEELGQLDEVEYQAYQYEDPGFDGIEDVNEGGLVGGEMNGGDEKIKSNESNMESSEDGSIGKEDGLIGAGDAPNGKADELIDGREESEVSIGETEEKAALREVEEEKDSYEYDEYEYEYDRDERMVPENVPFCESPSPEVMGLVIKDQPLEEEVALLNRKLTDNDTQEDTAVDNYSFLSSIINHDKEYLSKDVEEEQQATRESLLDKSTIWRNVNSISGSSVPYMSDLPIPKHDTPPLISFNPSAFLRPSFSAQLSFSPTKNAVDQQPKEQPQKLSIKKPLSLSTHQLPSFAAAPRQQPVWITSRPEPYDIPPLEENKQNEQLLEDDTVILERVSECFTSDDANILVNLKRICSVQEWCQLTKLDLSRQHLTSINNLNISFPLLEYLQISHNQLESLSNLPTTLIYLYASNNTLVDIDIYQLHNLQVLNIAHNHIQYLEDMVELKSLRVIDASHNSITSCKSFQNLPVLSKLSLKSNCIRRLVNFTSMIQDNQLEILDVSYNRIESLDSIENLTHLCYLNAEHNNIKYIQLDQPMEKLYKLQLSFNQLKSVDVSQFPGIRTLYLDDNVIHRIIGMNCISRIESFSLRDQGGSTIDYNLQYLRATKKLYLSGSPFHRLSDFFSLEYLELCAAHIEHLPTDFAKHVPNLSTLYLSFNRLTNIRPLRNLKYLRRLVLIDNRLIHIHQVVDVVKNMKRLHYLDLRQNPMTTNIYPPIHLKTLESNADKVSLYVVSALDSSWSAQDDKFCLTLEPQWIRRRSTYRSAFIQSCSKLVELDHVKISPDERRSTTTTSNSSSSSVNS